MKISTVPFFPASDFNECSVPSTSGSENSSIVEPIAGGAGTSPASAAPAITNTKTTRIDRFLNFIYYVSLTTRDYARDHRNRASVANSRAHGCRRALHRTRRHDRVSRFGFLCAQRSHGTSQSHRCLPQHFFTGR